MASLSIYVALCLAICMVRVNNAETCNCTAQQKYICRINAGQGEEVDCFKSQCYSICAYIRPYGEMYGRVYSVPNGSYCVLSTGYPGRCSYNRCVAFQANDASE